MIRLKIQNLLFEFIASIFFAEDFVASRQNSKYFHDRLESVAHPGTYRGQSGTVFSSEHGTFPTESLHLYKLTNSFMTCQHPSYIWRIVWINKNLENHTLACLFLSKNYWRSDLAFGQRCISTSIFQGKPLKTRPFPTQKRGHLISRYIWVPIDSKTFSVDLRVLRWPPTQGLCKREHGTGFDVYERKDLVEARFVVSKLKGQMGCTGVPLTVYPW